MSLVGDLVLQTANAPGTSTFSLIAPVSGRVSFVNGNGAGQAYYVAHDGTNWEKGYGTVVAGSPDTLSRDLVLKNSSGTQPSKINFASTVTILSDVPAERAIYASADNGSVPLSSRVMTAAGAAFAADHVPRYDQVGEVRYPTYSASSGNILVPLPNGTDLFTIDMVALTAASTVPLYFRISVNGGSSFLAGGTEYGCQNLASVGTTVTSTAAVTPYAPLGVQNAASGSAIHGEIELYPGSRAWRSRLHGFNGSSLTQEWTAGNWTTAGTATHVLISAVGSTLSAGQARLMQKVL